MSNPATSPAVHGLVLAGGRSRRMGRDKAGIVIGNTTLLARSVAMLQAYLPRVLVSVRPDQKNDEIRSAFELLPDQHAEIGPAAGILAAHALNPEVAWLVLACDMPGISSQDIEALLNGRDASAAATAFTTARDAAPEPLCAIYEPGTLADFAARIAAGGTPSPRSWLETTNTCLIVAATGQTLKSVNTEDDLRDLEPSGSRLPE